MSNNNRVLKRRGSGADAAARTMPLWWTACAHCDESRGASCALSPSRCRPVRSVRGVLCVPARGPSVARAVSTNREHAAVTGRRMARREATGRCQSPVWATSAILSIPRDVYALGQSAQPPQAPSRRPGRPAKPDRRVRGMQRRRGPRRDLSSLSGDTL